METNLKISPKFAEEMHLRKYITYLRDEGKSNAEIRDCLDEIIIATGYDLPISRIAGDRK